MDFACGGMAALMSISIMHPVDVVKTRLQFQGESLIPTASATLKKGVSPGSKTYQGIVRSLILIGKTEGISGLYRGLTYAYCLQFATTGTRFGTYNVTKRMLGESRDGTTSNLEKFSLAIFAGLCGATTGCPFFRLKTESQTYSTSAVNAVGTQHKPTGFMTALIDIYKTEGIKGYWKGYSAFALRVMAYSSMQLSSYDITKKFLVSKGMNDSVETHVSASFMAAIFGVTFMQPFDFIAARLMNQPIDPITKKGTLYQGVFDCIKKSIRNEGPGCLFKGCTANYARMGPYTVLCFVFFEQLKSLAHL